ncbi:MAG: hypothetical protein WC986_15020 [Elusimicrobiota bacterium]|jgi:hypothetical protein
MSVFKFEVGDKVLLKGKACVVHDIQLGGRWTLVQTKATATCQAYKWTPTNKLRRAARKKS